MMTGHASVWPLAVLTRTATHRDLRVLVREGRVLAATFHPEATRDGRLHRVFLEDVVAAPPAVEEVG